MSEPWDQLLKSKTRYRVCRIAALALLFAWGVSWSIPAKAQGNGVAEYARNSKKLDKKAAKQQRAAMKKLAKAQRKAAKKARRRTK
jgi:hypothetical protein